MSEAWALFLRWEPVIGWLLVAFFCKSVLKWSLKEIFAAIMLEIRDTLKLRPSVAGLNGMFLALVFLSIVILASLPSFSRLFSLLRNLNNGVSINVNLAFMALVVSGCVSLLCVLRTRGDGR